VEHNTPRFRTLFAHLLEDRAPLVIHCTAGKDRTGFACAELSPNFGDGRAGQAAAVVG
ncbi:tyrosine-protein phosphatase, partial [Acinetobacter baumannii]